MTEPKFSFHRMRRFVVDLLSRIEVEPDQADITAQRVLEADLRGRGGHGLIRLPQYVAWIEEGRINLRPHVEINRVTPVSALIDGDNGIGQVVMTRATELVIEKASTTGMAWVGTLRSNHAGAAGVYTDMVLRQGLISIYMAAGSVNVMPPWGGREALLGTNPLAIAVPGDKEPGFQLDIATTMTSRGTIKEYAGRGEPLPEGWVVDADGIPITDPSMAEENFLLPIGGHKGSGLSIALGLLAGVLNGAAVGVEVSGIEKSFSPANAGQAIFAMRPDLFRDSVEFKRGVDEHIGELRKAGNPGAVRIPGDRAVQLETEQRQEGIRIDQTLVERLRDLGQRYGLDDDLS